MRNKECRDKEKSKLNANACKKEMQTNTGRSKSGTMSNGSSILKTSQS